MDKTGVFWHTSLVYTNITLTQQIKEKDIVNRGIYVNILFTMITFGPLLITNLEKNPPWCKSCTWKLCKTIHTTDSFKSTCCYKLKSGEQFFTEHGCILAFITCQVILMNQKLGKNLKGIGWNEKKLWNIQQLYFLVIALIIVLKAPSNYSLNFRLQKLIMKSEIPSLLHLKLLNV